MNEAKHLDAAAVAADWRTAANYACLLACDRRAFAWEWLRRNSAYRRAATSGSSDPTAFGLVAFADPDLPISDARPIWAPKIDPQVLEGYVHGTICETADQFDIRALANLVSVEVRDGTTEHWLFSNGKWCVRLDLHDGTLLGGPLSLGHRMQGLASAEPKLVALRQLLALARQGDLPVGLQPKEVRAPRWVLELRTADGIAAGASQHEMARLFFGQSVAAGRWRVESASYRLRIQRLARAARRNLDAPLDGPWFG